MVGIWVHNKHGHTDRIRVTVRRADGSIKSDHYLNDSLIHRIFVKLHLSHNTMTKYGFAAAAGLLANIGSYTAFGSIGIGTGTNPSSVNDQYMQTPLKIKSVTPTQVTTSYSNDTVQWQATFSNALDGLTGTDSITEIAILNGNTNTTPTIMLLHQVYSPADSVNFSQGDTITVTVTDKMEQGS